MDTIASRSRASRSGLDEVGRPVHRGGGRGVVLPIALLAALLLAACGTQSTTPVAAQASPALDVTAIDAVSLRDRLAKGELDAESVTRAYLDRIAEIDDDGPRLNAIIAINPDALAIARELDRRFAESGPVGPLHGVPVVLKDNIDTGDAMATTAGSLALAGQRADKDAFHVARLRDAGAVILAKANLSEWANFRDDRSSSGWSSLGGQTRNPHVLDRNPCGSSSGSAVAVAAALAPLAVGTETNGSIVCPSGVNGIVGIKPTLGVVSRSGIVPIAHSQDTAGPMARSVAGAALLLESLIAHDPADPGAQAWPGGAPDLAPDPASRRLDGLRIGVYRSYYGAGQHPNVEAVFENAVAQLAGLGAELVDPIEYTPPAGQGDPQRTVLTVEFKHDLDAYLATRDLPGDVDSLEDLVAWNSAHADTAMPIFGQSVFEEAVATTGLDDPAYLEALEANNAHMRRTVEGWLEAQSLDALVMPVNGPAWKTDWVGGDRYTFGGTSSLTAISGLPSIVIPAGEVSGLPVAVGFAGTAFSEASLVQMAWVLEQSLQARREPAFLPSIEE